MSDAWTKNDDIMHDLLEGLGHKKAGSDKYEGIDFKPPKAVAEAARKGLEYRAKASPSQKGGLTPSEASRQGIGSGVQRAVNLKNRDNMSPEVIRQMCAFFARHEKNKGVAPEHKDEPWNDKGHVAHLLWGGDPGKAWAEKVRDQMDRADEKGKKASETPTCARCALGGERIPCGMSDRGAWLCDVCGWTLWGAHEKEESMRDRVASRYIAAQGELLEAARGIFRGESPDDRPWHGGPIRVGVGFNRVGQKPDDVRVDQEPDGSVKVRVVMRIHVDGKSKLLGRFLDRYGSGQDAQEALRVAFEEAIRKSAPDLHKEVEKWVRDVRTGRALLVAFGWKNQDEWETPWDIDLGRKFIRHQDSVITRHDIVAPTTVEFTFRTRPKARRLNHLRE